jgi:uncharacterized protein YcbX
MSAFVSGLATTPVKATRVASVETVELDRFGARGNRVFCVIDGRDRMVNGKVFADLQRVISCYHEATGELTMLFPDGARVHGEVHLGQALTIRFFSRTREVRIVDGPWSAALSGFLGAPLRLVAPEVGVDRGRQGGVSVISRASVRELAEFAGREWIDVRRFRMLVEIDGVEPYEEDSWVGRKVRIGAAVMRMRGNVGRCLITSRDPDSAKTDLPTLDLLASHRGGVHGTEPLPFGIHGEVLEPGIISVGDPVTPEVDPVALDGDPVRLDGDPVRLDGDPVRLDGDPVTLDRDRRRAPTDG